mmetsp:Transcript_6797/g.13877  ORF Transcript_6797/g.13877 Transcript_6797/m.13877 type:complete len:171 (+) Transcript_6797:668-1180(+)
MEETTDEWWECPLFAPPGSVIPRLEGVSAEEQRVPSALAALSHVLYDEETPQERAELIREHGNRFFRHGPRFQKEAVRLYTEAIGVGCDVPEVIAANYNNRAAAHLVRITRVSSLGRALTSGTPPPIRNSATTVMPCRTCASALTPNLTTSKPCCGALFSLFVTRRTTES